MLLVELVIVVITVLRSEQLLVGVADYYRSCLACESQDVFILPSADFAACLSPPPQPTSIKVNMSTQVNTHIIFFIVIPLLS